MKNIIFSINGGIGKSIIATAVCRAIKKTYKDNKEMLAKINDYTWLEYEFNGHVKMFPPETFKGDWPLEEKSQQ